MVHTQNMELIRNSILTLAGGMMHTDTLNLLTVILAFVFVTLSGVGIVYALNLHNVKDNRPKTPITIDDAQG